MEEPVVYFRRLEGNKLENVIKYSFYEALKKENLGLKEKLKKACLMMRNGLEGAEAYDRIIGYIKRDFEHLPIAGSKSKITKP